MPRTLVYYFAEGDLDDLDAAIDALDEDLRGRRPYVDAETIERIDHRISLLRTARALLAEPIVEGG